MNRIARIAKTVCPPPVGTALAAYDATGALLVLVPCKPRRIMPWIMRPVSKSDRLRVSTFLDRQPPEEPPTP